MSNNINSTSKAKLTNITWRTTTFPASTLRDLMSFGKFRATLCSTTHNSSVTLHVDTTGLKTL